MNHKKAVQYRQMMEDTIERVGWMVQGVFDPDGKQLPYVYTIGNFLVGLPEIAISGLNANLMMRFVNDVSRQMRDGSLVMKDGLVSKEIAQGYDTVFRQVTDSTYLEYFGKLVEYSRYKQQPIQSAYQLVFPDTENRFPWEPNCDQTIIDAQYTWYPSQH